MNTNNIKITSKFLSLILRHNPGKIGLDLDKNGWANVDDLLNKSQKKHRHITMEILELVVETNDKNRFAFNADKTKIRANQGHSLKTIDLQLKPVTPPAFLYHGTVAKFMEAIQKEGLKKQNRQHVHLSVDTETAIKVGSRRGKPIILSIRALDMYKEGFPFYLSENKVWLTDAVPSAFIDFKEN
ncbi:RNA 2'-phosphotransferase [Olleya sp. R77988]|uniref:RNA 2'-phosphotransferase n=1 Tax=Olleya sp. R77988 TaxID=3093875 RepID=UPI0037CB0D0C